MRAYWYDNGAEVTPEAAREVSREEADRIWSDSSGVEGNFFGLIDDDGRTVQFYFDADIPDEVEDARHLEIVLLDLPQAELQGSYACRVTIGEVRGLIEIAFRSGADPAAFGALEFMPW